MVLLFLGEFAYEQRLIKINEISSIEKSIILYEVI
jgi:hypothetical protein